MLQPGREERVNGWSRVLRNFTFERGASPGLPVQATGGPVGQRSRIPPSEVSTRTIDPRAVDVKQN
jgi:hypothetical protein